MRIVAPLCLAALLAACASGTGGSPVSYGGGSRSSAGPATSSSGPQSDVVTDAAPRLHQPAPPPNWAAGPGTPLSAYALQPDAAQPYDPAHPPRAIRVAPGQTLYDVAVAYQIPLRALIDQNNLSPPYALSPGQTLELPPPRFHRVRQGEALTDIAAAYQIDARSLALLNRLAPPYNVRPGDALVLPSMARPWISAPQSASAPAPSVAGNGRFVWPLRGRVLSQFGQQHDGRRIDGIEIAADEGARIGAADAGEVVYAGSDLPAYGTLVLVRHADNYVTAYGYARRALVREGERVTRGQALAEVGRVGSGSPKLLFQVRQGTQAVDPMTLLGR